MSSQKTTNYDLNQWLPDDAVLRTDFNADNAKIDAALAAMSEQVVQKANQSALDTLITAVNQKAGQDDLTALSQTHASDVSQLRAENCWVKLSETVLTAAAASYSWSIPNPGSYEEFQCRFIGKSTGVIQLSVNGGADFMYSSQKTTFTESTIVSSYEYGAGGRIDLFPIGGSSNVILQYTAAGFSNLGTGQIMEKSMCSDSLTFAQLSSVTLTVDSGTFLAGTRFVLYGMKK